MTDNTLKTAAENKIKELERMRTNLNEQLSSKQSFNLAAWSEYGSELCAGEMIRDEQEISNRISEIVNKIALLRKFIQGELDVSAEEKLKKNSEEIAARIVALQGSKQLVDGELSEIMRVKNLLNLTF